MNNNNIIINNKYETSEKPITNLNMIFKFKTILNEETNAKNNKIVKIDAKKIIRNPSANKNIKNNTGNVNNEKTSSVFFNSNNINNNTINVNNYNSNSGNLIQKQNNLVMNSSIKNGVSNSKSKQKNLKNNTNNIEYKNFDSLKYSINQLKDYLNPSCLGNDSKSKSKSKGKISSLGNYGKK